MDALRLADNSLGFHLLASALPTFRSNTEKDVADMAALMKSAYSVNHAATSNLALAVSHD